MESRLSGRVLLIEDDAGFLRAMSIAFIAAGYEVKAAADGGQGLAIFRRWPADLVVTDMIMPVREGVETIVALKQRIASVKVIAISGGFRVGPQDYLNLARHVGADETLAKPFPMSDLVAAASRLLASPAVITAPPPDAARLEATLDLAERLDDALLLVRLLAAQRAGADTPDA